MRRSLEETWLALEACGARPPRHPDGRPVVPDRMPSHDDDGPLGLSFFRCELQDVDHTALTLPRTFVGHASLQAVRFARSDLSSSRMCWNDFVDCDFTEADLSGADLRSSTFRRCTFRGARMRDADLRRSTFEACDLTGADLTGATAQDGLRGALAPEQLAAVVFGGPGPEPAGG